MNKNAIELVHKHNSLGFFNRLFLVPKPNNKWRPILDLSLFLKAEKFKMETPETIRTSLQQGEWVTSIDFKDAYFHIPIQEQSRKYLRFHVQGQTCQFKALPFGGQTCQFKALPFGLSTAPMEFTVIAKEVKLMAIHKGIRIHQYLDDWLVRATSHRLCLKHTQALVTVCQKLGWLVNMEKSELVPKQVFNFIALIHPIQWTIAKPVGADRPAKRQKKTSCVSTGWPVPVLCIRKVAHGIYFLSRQYDVIASFSFGACTVQTCFQHLQFFKGKVCFMTDFQPYMWIFSV